MSEIYFFINEAQETIALEYQTNILLKKQNKIIDFYLETIISYDDYQTIANQQLFNLISEVKSPLFNDSFLTNYPLKMKIKIDKKILNNLTNNHENEEQIGQYLIQISDSVKNNINNKIKEYNINPLLVASNWYCLEIEQSIETKKIGYQTLWNQIYPELYLEPATKEQKKSQNSDPWVDDEVSAEWEEASNKIENFFDNLITTIDESIKSKKETDQSISEIVKEFLREDNWNYLQLNDGITLKLSCQGNNGQISCYARSLEENKQFIFYSLFPEVIPEQQREAIAELITKINYGMIIGNLEMDFNDGELRYKTSIDVEGDRLSPALLKRLIYANISTMDQYLPAITAIIHQEYSVDEAIAQVEN